MSTESVVDESRSDFRWPPAYAESRVAGHGSRRAQRHAIQDVSNKVLGREVSYLVYLPAGYEKGKQRYPVIYWLHGMGGNQRGGAMMFVPQVEAAIKEGVLPPTIRHSARPFLRR